MNVDRKRSLARRIGIASATVVALCTTYLIFSYLSASRQAVSDKALIESMEEAVKTDAAVSVELTAERDRQTKRSIERRQTTDWVAIVLMLGAIAFLSSMNWKGSLEQAPVISLERLQSFRRAGGSSSRAPESPLWNLEGVDRPEIDLSIVEHIVQQEGRTSEAAIPILREVQRRYGYLPDEALKRVCELTEISPAQIAGTSTFYSQFRQSPVGEHLVKICHGTACHVSGAVQITEELRRYLSIPPGEDTDPAQFFTLEKVACVGCCSLAPVLMVDDQTVGRLTPVGACHALNSVNSEKSA